MDPQPSARGIQPSERGQPRASRHVSCSRVGSHSASRVHFLRSPRATTGFCGGHEPGDKVPGTGLTAASRSLQVAVVDTSRDRGRLPRSAASGRPGAFDQGRTVSAVRSNRAPGTGSSAAGASGQWRIGRSSTRPVLKHGPRSLACARVMGSHETQRRNESEGRLRQA